MEGAPGLPRARGFSGGTFSPMDPCQNIPTVKEECVVKSEHQGLSMIGPPKGLRLKRGTEKRVGTIFCSSVDSVSIMPSWLCARIRTNHTCIDRVQSSPRIWVARTGSTVDIVSPEKLTDWDT